jgi:4'-phosphopantetheinyl transferase EntD
VTVPQWARPPHQPGRKEMQRNLRGRNPAVLRAELAALFPAGVVAADLGQPAPRELLTAQELSCVSHCANERIEQFAAGRLCARLALEAIGVAGFSLLSAPDRQPLWPAGVTGSITHTAGYAAAVVGHRGALSSLGIDSEVVAEVHEELWPGITAPGELARLRALPAAAGRAHAAVLFAAKEAFYKSQFPLTGEWLLFDDVVIEIAADGNGETGGFRVLPQRPLAVGREVRAELAGRYRLHGPFVTAGLALPS